MPTIYESAAGTYHRARADAGKGAIKHEIGTDKDSLIAALSLARNGRPAGEVKSTTTPAAGEPFKLGGVGEAEWVVVDKMSVQQSCPRCKFTERQAQAYLEHRKNDLNVQAVRQWIEEAPGSPLSSIVEAVTWRLSELAKAATA